MFILIIGTNYCLVRAVSATNPSCWNPKAAVRNIVLVCVRREYRCRRTRSHRKGSIIIIVAAAAAAEDCARTFRPRNRPRTLRHPPPSTGWPSDPVPGRYTDPWRPRFCRWHRDPFCRWPPRDPPWRRPIFRRLCAECARVKYILYVS